MQAGKLSQRITLQKPIATRDAIGGEVRSFATEWIGWATVEAITGREVHAADQLRSGVTLRVTVRQPGPKPDATWRALWNGAVLSIAAVLPTPTRDRLTLLCSQGVIVTDQ